MSIILIFWFWHAWLFCIYFALIWLDFEIHSGPQGHSNHRNQNVWHQKSKKNMKIWRLVNQEQGSLLFLITDKRFPGCLFFQSCFHRLAIVQTSCKPCIKYKHLVLNLRNRITCLKHVWSFSQHSMCLLYCFCFLHWICSQQLLKSINLVTNWNQPLELKHNHKQHRRCESHATVQQDWGRMFNFCVLCVDCEPNCLKNIYILK